MLILLCAAFLVSAGPYKCGPHRIKESIAGPPHGWLRRGPAPPDHLLELKIALPQPDFPILDKRFWEVSDPKHERYGAYFSRQETEGLMAPRRETLDVVNEWLSLHGIEEERIYRSSAKDWITTLVPVELAEEMLKTKYHVYTHSDSGESIVRTTSYSLPESLHEHVELIQPTTMFTRLRPFRSTLHWSNEVSSSSVRVGPSTGTLTGPTENQVDASCNSTITITCLRQLYNAVGYNTSATNGNRIAVTSYLEQFANNKDLEDFFRLENPAAIGSRYTLVSIDSGLNKQSRGAAGVEANLDTQFAFGLTHPTPATLYSTSGRPPYTPDAQTPTNTNEPYVKWPDYVHLKNTFLRQSPPVTAMMSKQVFSSAPLNDALSPQTVPHCYAFRVYRGFAAIGVRGVSLIFSSGDGGVGDGISHPARQKCFSNDGVSETMFLPAFPASCPFVMSVGGTSNIRETAASLSGGGFSNYFPRPGYQQTAVLSFFQTLPPGIYEGLYKSNGRGIPDVSAQAVHFAIVHQGREGHVSGTSCSAPTFASIISMLNDARLTAGKPPLGFLNPWLYGAGAAGLNDVTVGNNPGCGTEGFNATRGWDPVTGLGTPDFWRLLELAMQI